MEKSSIGYLKGLDILRFIAATGVILHHTSLSLDRQDLYYLTIFYDAGTYFLNLFFVISGFLISSILFKEFDAGKFNLKNFFIRRILRIWPMYFFAVILFVLIIPTINHVPAFKIRESLLFASLFITNYQLLFSTISRATYVILWSVGIEEHIYIIFPFLMYVFRKKKMALAVFLIVTGILSWLFIRRIVGPIESDNNVPYFFTTSYFYYFGAGCLLAVIQARKGAITEKVNSVIMHPIAQWTLILAGFAIIFGNLLQGYSTLLYLLFTGTFTSYLVYCAANSKLVIDVLPDKVSRFLGNVSYPMYLLHIRVLGLCFPYVLAMDYDSYIKYDALLPLAVVSITILLSAIANLVIEKPFLGLKKRFTAVYNK